MTHPRVTADNMAATIADQLRALQQSEGEAAALRAVIDECAAAMTAAIDYLDQRVKSGDEAARGPGDALVDALDRSRQET